MRYLLTVAAAAVLLAEPAFAFNNIACAGFLIGTWQSEGSEKEGARRMVLNANGTAVVTEELRADADGMVISEPPKAGRWSAGPGANDNECAVETKLDGQTVTGTIVVVDDNAITIRETRYAREK